MVETISDHTSIGRFKWSTGNNEMIRVELLNLEIQFVAVLYCYIIVVCIAV